MRHKKRILGAAIIALPFVSLFAFIVSRDGWIFATLLFVFVFAVVALFWFGIGLLVDK